MLQTLSGLDEGRLYPNLSYNDMLFINRTNSDILLIYAYYPLFLYATGIPANVLSIYILRSSESLRRNFVSVFLVYLSFCNILNSLVGLSRFFLLGMFGFDIRSTSLVANRLQSSMAMIFHVVANWILTSLSVCKLLYIVYPHHANIWCRGSLTHVIMMFILLAATLIHFFVTEGGKKVVFYETASIGKSEHFLTYSRSRAVTQACIFFYIPAGLILLINFSIIFLYSRTRRNMQSRSRIFRRHLLIAYRFAIITLLCDIQIMMMEFPYAYFFTEKYLWVQSGPVEEAKANLFYSVAVMMLYTNYSINFIVYCFFGNHYRQELRKMLRPCIKKVLSQENIWLSTETESSDFSYESAFMGQGNLQAAGSLRNLFHDPLEETRASRRRSEQRATSLDSECSTTKRHVPTPENRQNWKSNKSIEFRNSIIHFSMDLDIERQKPRALRHFMSETAV